MRTRIENAPMTRLAILGLAGLLILGRAAPTQAQSEEKLKIVTTLVFLKAIAEEVGGDRVIAQSLSDPRQDPHYVQPRPTLMKRTRGADLFIEVGLDLELWAQKVIDGSANPAIQMGQPGRVIASAGIATQELPEQLSREWGDVHPYGNPHVWLDPINAKKIAENIASALGRLDPAHREDYEQRVSDFKKRIDIALFGEDLLEAIGSRRLTRLAKQGRLRAYLDRKDLGEKLGGWLKKGEALRGQKVVTFHKTWIYFARRFGMTIPIEIEEKPGIPPSAKHRDRVIQVIREGGIKTIVISSFYDRSAADYVAEKTGAAVVVVPIDLGAAEGVHGYFDLIDYLISQMTAPGREEP